MPLTAESKPHRSLEDLQIDSLEHLRRREELAVGSFGFLTYKTFVEEILYINM
jgi:hypothetical protein